MLDLQALLAAKEFDDTSITRHLSSVKDDRSRIEQFLNEHQFTDMDIIGAGTSALVLRDKANPDLVVRIAYQFPPEIGDSERAVMPHVLQAIFSKSFLDEEDIPLKIEILPYAGNSDLLHKEWDALCRQFDHEIMATRLIQSRGKCAPDDLGVFVYTDRTGAKKQVVIALDDSVFNADFCGEPRCTVNYPSLAIQQARHQELWEADKRLQNLLPNGPAKLPETRIISNPERNDVPLT